MHHVSSLLSKFNGKVATVETAHIISNHLQTRFQIKRFLLIQSAHLKPLWIKHHCHFVESSALLKGKCNDFDQRFLQTQSKAKRHRHKEKSKTTEPEDTYL